MKPEKLTPILLWSGVALTMLAMVPRVLGSGAGILGALAIMAGLAAGGFLIAAGFIAAYKRRIDQLVARVASHRPGSTIIPALSPPELGEIARSAGSTQEGWRRTGGTILALAVEENRVEVWTGLNEAHPRWSVALEPGGVRQVSVMLGGNAWPGVEVADGVSRVVFVPYYAVTTVFSEQPRRFAARAMDELGVATG